MNRWLCFPFWRHKFASLEVLFGANCICSELSMFELCNKDKWRKVIVPAMMSSDESGKDDEGIWRAVKDVKNLLCRSDTVGTFFQRLNHIEVQKKSEQAVQQSKPRILVSAVSDRPPPTNIGTIPQWAVCASADKLPSSLWLVWLHMNGILLCILFYGAFSFHDRVSCAVSLWFHIDDSLSYGISCM